MRMMPVTSRWASTSRSVRGGVFIGVPGLDPAGHRPDVGMAGQSSIDRNKASEAYDRRERGRAIVPRRESKIADFINPSPQSFGFVKEQEQKNKDLFSRQLYPADRRKQPAGLPANETNENAYREMVHLDGDSRQAKRIEADDRSAYGEDEGPPRLSAQMSILGQDADARRPDYRVHQ